MLSLWCHYFPHYRPITLHFLFWDVVHAMQLQRDYCNGFSIQWGQIHPVCQWKSFRLTIIVRFCMYYSFSSDLCSWKINWLISEILITLNCSSLIEIQMRSWVSLSEGIVGELQGFGAARWAPGLCNLEAAKSSTFSWFWISLQVSEEDLILVWCMLLSSQICFHFS